MSRALWLTATLLFVSVNAKANDGGADEGTVYNGTGHELICLGDNGNGQICNVPATPKQPCQGDGFYDPSDPSGTVYKVPNGTSWNYGGGPPPEYSCGNLYSCLVSIGMGAGGYGSMTGADFCTKMGNGQICDCTTDPTTGAKSTSNCQPCAAFFPTPPPVADPEKPQRMTAE